MDWHNRLEVVCEKLKFQLYNRGVDSIGDLEKYFMVTKQVKVGDRFGWFR